MAIWGQVSQLRWLIYFYCEPREPHGVAVILPRKTTNFPGLVMVNSLLWEMAIEIVSFPIKNCDFP